MKHSHHRLPQINTDEIFVSLYEILKYMKKYKLLFIGAFLLPVLMLSCGKENAEITESEIIFEIPVYGDTIFNYTITQIKAFPNPFTDLIQISSFLPEGDTATIQLSNENGDFMNSAKLSAGVWAITTEDYPKGVYYIEVLKDGYVDRAKMLKIE